jgi:hypothetical protein
MDCITEGPFFSGMSEETCHVYGGTFCPVSDCTDLMNCVDGFRLHENKAFALYVNASPIISNPTDPFECGRAREYFGFQDNFINDQQICDDIGQLALTRDFTILNEFFDQDGDGSGGGGVSPISGPKLESPQLSTLWSVPLHLCCNFKLTHRMMIPRLVVLQRMPFRRKSRMDRYGQAQILLSRRLSLPCNLLTA